MPGGSISDLGCEMDSGTENQDLHSRSIQSPPDQSLLQNNSSDEGSSDVEKKPPEETDQTSSQLTETSTQSGEAESCSRQGSSRKRKRGPRDSLCDGAGPSLGEECSVVLEKRAKRPGAGHSSCSQASGHACPSRAQRKRPGHRKQPRPRPSRVQPPVLRKSLVTSLRTVSEATYLNIVQMQQQQAPAPLSWEHHALLAQLRGHLHTQVQTIYAMATQAAYVFPATEWLVPALLPGPSSPGADGGDAQSPS